MEQGTFDLFKVIKILWKNKHLLVLGTLICGILGAGISLILPRKYEATVTLLISPPKFQTELQPSTLSPPTYQTMIVSKDLLKKVIEKLNLKKIKVEELQKNLDTRLVIEDKGAGQKTYAPVIQLIARGNSPKEAAEIANTWAEIFVEENTRLSSYETEASYGFLTSQFSITTSALMNAETQLRDFKEQSRLELLYAQISTSLTKLENYRGVGTDLKYDFDVKTARLIRLEKQVDSQEYNGTWIGFIKPDMTSEDFAQQMQVYTEKKLDPSVAEIRQQVLDTKKNLIHAQDDLRQFLDTHKIEMIKQQFNDQNQELVRTRIEYTQDQVRVQSLEVSVSNIRKQLETQEKFIVLKKAITDEALWNRVISSSATPNDQQKLADLKLETEEINPVYLSLVKQLVDLEVELNTLTPKVEGMKGKIQAVDSTVRELDSLLNDYDNQKTRLENRLAIAKANYDIMAERYTSLKNDLIAAQQEVDILKTRVAETNATIQKLSSDVNALQLAIYKGDMALAQYDRATATYKVTYDLIAEKAEKAKIAKAEIFENVKIAGHAIEPQLPVWPKRTLITLLSGFIGLVLSILWVLFKEYFSIPE